MSLLLAHFWLSLALALAQMVLEVGKNLNPTRFYMQNILCLSNFPKKSSPGSVLAPLAVFGSGLDPDGPGRQEKH